MRQITVKYQGECGKCGEALEIGNMAMYERITGIFCGGCAPIDTEDIRAYRQEKADRKAERLERWAEKREQRANVQLNSQPNLRHDWAFITQPGHIPARARMNKADERAFESLGVANQLRGRAGNIRNVRVKGDAARADALYRAEVDTWVKVGMVVHCGHYVDSEVLKVNKKTVTIKGRFGNFIYDKIFIKQINEN